MAKAAGIRYSPHPLTERLSSISILGGRGGGSALGP